MEQSTDTTGVGLVRQRGARARSKPHGGWDGEDGPPGANDTKNNPLRPSGVFQDDQNTNGHALQEQAGDVTDADTLGRDLRRQFQFAGGQFLSRLNPGKRLAFIVCSASK